MNFFESVRSGFSNYANFNGRASRSEFWWWFLFVILVILASAIISEVLYLVVVLGLLLPNIAISCRRLHDTDRSGWWQLLGLVPLVGLVLLFWYVQAGKEVNRFSSQEVAA